VPADPQIALENGPEPCYTYLRFTRGSGVLALSFVIWLFVFVFVSYGLGRLYAPLRRSRFFKMCFAPGFLILGGLKVLACSISGAEVRSVKFFARDREAVSYDPDDVTFLGKIILATFPIIGALLVFVVIAWAFAYPVGYRQSEAYTAVPDSVAGGIYHLGHAFLDSLVEMMRATAEAFSEAGHGNLLPFVYLYLLISIILAVPPPTRELKHALLGVLIIALVILVIGWAGIRLSGRAADVRTTIWKLSSFALALLVYVTAVTLAAILLGSLVSSITSRRNKPDEPRS
jgi:hypothetical protein